MSDVSIIIPTYNRADLISETLQSVLQQTYRDYEIIVVNDGSTDRTLAVLASFGDQIRVIEQTNQGLSEARNTGLCAAEGRYVAFIDSDDLWCPTKLERQMALLKSMPDLRWVYSDAEVFDSDTNQTLYNYGQLFGQLPQGTILQHLLFGDFIASPTPVIERAIFDDIGKFYDNKVVAEDWDMWLRIAARYPIGLVNEPLARYRVHANMKSLNRSWMAQHERCMNTINRAVARNPEELDKLHDSALAQQYVQTGNKLVESGETGARALYQRAIRLAPTMVKAYIGWAVSLTGNRAAKSILSLRTRLRNYRSAPRDQSHGIS